MNTSNQNYALVRRAFRAAEVAHRAGNDKRACLLRDLAEALQESTYTVDRLLSDNSSLDALGKKIDRMIERGK